MNLVYLHGFASGPGSTKAAYFRQRLPGLAVPDLAGGDFAHLTVTRQLRIVAEAAGSGPVTLVGSSMGAYVAAIYAAGHAEVERLVLMAPAFAFARRFAEYLGRTALADWQRSGWLETWNYAANAPARVHWDLLEDARAYPDFPDFTQPALILHGLHDNVVPYHYSEQFAATHPNARLVPLDSDHELTGALDALWNASAEFLGL